MITQMVDLNQYHQRGMQIKARVPVILSHWGLLPKFTRWRLAQDPETGLVVFFAVLNTKFIATHTATPFNDYFDPRLLHDLANDLQVQIVSCNTDGLGYGFILDRGSIGKLPTHIDFPFPDGDRLRVGVVYNDELAPGLINPQTMQVPPIIVEIVDDHTLINQGVGAFLKVFDDIKLKDDAASKLSAQGLPDVVVIDAEGFHERVSEHKVNLQRQNRIKRLYTRPVK
jgi:hypothetical protein